MFHIYLEAWAGGHRAFYDFMTAVNSINQFLTHKTSVSLSQFADYSLQIILAILMQYS